MMARYRDIHLRVLKLLEDARVYGHVWTAKQITCCLTDCREELRYNIEAVDCLIRNHLVNLPQVNIFLILKFIIYNSQSNLLFNIRVKSGITHIYNIVPKPQKMVWSTYFL